VFYGAVKKITFFGGSGNDLFHNKTSISSWAYGMGGNDTLIGGSGADKLYGSDGADILQGGAGNDSLFGGNQNDTLQGGAGDDLVRGDSGNDSLHGENGSDRLEGAAGSDNLHGGDGHDVLYGDEGTDILSGGAGRDGLYGGLGFDTLKGGSGADRFLTDDFLADSVLDQTSADAKIHFDNGNTVLHDGAYYSWKSWSQDEIEQVDAAFAVLHETAGDTHLLKLADGSPMTFVRRGASVATDTDVLGWNSGGHMTILDKAFDSSGILLRQVVYHEVGHNWDSLLISPGFNALSTWLAFPKNLAVPSGFVRAMDTDGDPQPWIFAATATFARPYGATNPREDFATAFAAYFMNEEGTTYVGGPGASAIPGKIAWIDTFIV
jgi:Ca2+-binding RTX toxin-like protein